jgi:clan AA aspartic protease
MHPSDRSRKAEVDLLVDTGATLTWVPRQIVEQLGLPRLTKRGFLIADGSTIERETAGALLRVRDVESIVTLVIAEPGDGRLLGATALESLGFAVDPVNLRLVPQALLAMRQQ